MWLSSALNSSLASSKQNFKEAAALEVACVVTTVASRAREDFGNSASRSKRKGLLSLSVPELMLFAWIL